MYISCVSTYETRVHHLHIHNLDLVRGLNIDRCGLGSELVGGVGRTEENIGCP
jgi:hypothetical protein